MGQVTAEVNAAVTLINSRKNELETARGELLAISAEARSKTEALMIERYDQYFGELDAQASRLQSTLSCLTAF